MILMWQKTNISLPILNAFNPVPNGLKSVFSQINYLSLNGLSSKMLHYMFAEYTAYIFVKVEH